ncbi:MAG: hypothetical protein J3R72DRAFT_17473 [Linnemannia gamsii]|nr:MAG: hypothetical protein J3R72DRAFT_17473 [Linnemannia gamsii]
MTVSSSETASALIESQTTLTIPLEGLGSPILDVSNPTQAGNASGCQVNIDQNPPQTSSAEPSLHIQSPVQTGHPAVMLGPVSEHHLSVTGGTTTILSDLHNTCISHHSTTQANISPVNGDNTQAETFPEPTKSNNEDSQASATPLHVRGDLPKTRSDDLVGYFSMSALEARLKSLRLKKLEECLVPVYILLRAKDTPFHSDCDSFQLVERVQEFLNRDSSIFLLLGNSGAGKSLFLKQLERELWLSYKQGGRIPLHIDLPYIDRPERDLIEKQLRRHNFLDYEIRELLEHRQFVLLCDGYDECHLSSNLYTTNGLNLPGQQDVKMIISCRSTFLGRGYHGRFQPHGSDLYHDSSPDFFEEATIVPFSEADIRDFVQQHLHDAQEREYPDNRPIWTTTHFMNMVSTIPDMLSLIRNPFLLTLALEVLPSLPSDALDTFTNVKVTRLKLLSVFFSRWIQINKARLERTVLSPKISAVFVELCDSDAGFEGCVKLFLIRLAEAMAEHQSCHPVVEYEHSKHKKSWKAEFFAQYTKPTLLRDASPLTKTGTQHRFIHSAFFAYFRFRAAYDPDASDDSDDDSEDGRPDDDGDAFHSNKERSLRDSEDVAGGNGGFSGGNNNSTAGNGDSHGGDGDSPGGTGGSGGGSGSGGGGGSGGDRGASENGGSSRREKDGSDGDEDDPCRNPNGSRLKRKKRSIKPRRSISNDPLTTRNLFKDPEVLELLVECAASDPRLKRRLMKAIEQSKLCTTPSIGAANAIVILLRTGEQFHDTFLDDVSVPSDYLSEDVTESDEQPRGILTGAGLMDALLALDSSTTNPKSRFSSPWTLVPTLKNQRPINDHPRRLLSPPHHESSNPVAPQSYINNSDVVIAHLSKDANSSDSVLVGETAFVLPGSLIQLSTPYSTVTETMWPTELIIIDLPTEVFQHICRFCTLHELAAFRAVSKRARDMVDNSITSRKTFAEPHHGTIFGAKHNPYSCYVDISLAGRSRPFTAVFTRYNKEHNYFEFSQEHPDAARVKVEDEDSTLGQLYFSNWEHQLTSAKEARDARVSASFPSSSSSLQDSNSITSHPMIPTFMQAGPIHAAEIHAEQELNSGELIPPSPIFQAASIALFDFSETSLLEPGTLLPAADTPMPAAETAPPDTDADVPATGAFLQGISHMTQYVMNTFASATSESGMGTEQFTQEATQRFSSIDGECLSSKKQYKFDLTEGAHYIGDDDFIIRYTIKNVHPAMHIWEEEEEENMVVVEGEDVEMEGVNVGTAAIIDPAATLAVASNHRHLEFKVDFIRASWRWTASGVPKSLRPGSQPSTVGTTKTQNQDLNKDDYDEDEDEDDDDEDDRQPWQTLLTPLPDLRSGRMYARRFNMVLEEIGRQSVTTSVLGELKNMGYYPSLFPNKFIYANLYDENILEWVTEKHFEDIDVLAALREAQEQKDQCDTWETVEFTSASYQLSKYRTKRAKEIRDKADRAVLEHMVELIKKNQGYLTARNILEEMLVYKGYSCDLIWKYGILRREMTGPVPSQAVASSLLTDVIVGDAANELMHPPRPSLDVPVDVATTEFVHTFNDPMGFIHTVDETSMDFIHV